MPHWRSATIRLLPRVRLESSHAERRRCAAPRPLRSPKFTYDIYLTNGPGLVTNDPAAAGSLNFDDFTDLNNGKAAGGRLGFLPIPSLETGYSILYAQVSPAGFPKSYALLQAVDFNWVQEVRPLSGVFTVRAEWVWSDVGASTFDPRGSLGFGPTRFGNFRQGGYAELAYRPTLVENRVLRNFEGIFRYDLLRTPLQVAGRRRRTTLRNRIGLLAYAVGRFQGGV